jgi:EpsI family protein
MTERIAWPAPSITAPAAALALAACYSTVCFQLVRQWSIDPLYSFGFAVPLISGYVLANRRTEILAAIGRPDYVAGSALVVVAGLMVVVGELGTALKLQELSLVVMVAGVVLLLFGRLAFRRSWFPVVYLLLMIPVWTNAIGRLQGPSQDVSGRIAVTLFHVIGIPAVREGTLIYLPHVTLEVLRECSGANQLIAVFAMTVPAAYLWVAGNLRRTLFIGVALLIAYLSNGARIALAGVLAQNGVDIASPSIHLVEGLFVAVLAYGLIAVVLSAIAAPGWFDIRKKAWSEPTARLAPRRPWTDLALVAIVIASGSVRFLPHGSEVPLKAALESLPAHVGAWARDAASWEPPEGVDAAVTDEEVRLTYRRSAGERIRLYIGYLRRQQAGRGMAEASAELPRGTESVLDVGIAPDLSRLNLVEHRESGATSGVFYWYNIDGQTALDRYDVRRRVLWNAIKQGRSNGAVIMVFWEAPAGADFDASRERALDFIRSLVPILPKYLPSHA